MAWPKLSTYFQKPVFDQEGHPKGLSAAGIVSFKVIPILKPEFFNYEYSGHEVFGAMRCKADATYHRARSET